MPIKISDAMQQKESHVQNNIQLSNRRPNFLTMRPRITYNKFK